MDPVLKRGVDQRSVGDGPRYAAHIRYRIWTPSHRIPRVLLLDHTDDNDVVGGVDPEPGAVHAAPEKGARADGASIETGVRWLEHNANVHAIANTRERLREMHRHARRQQVGRHQLDGGWRQYPDTVERAAIRQHLRESDVVLHRGVEPGDRQQVFWLHTVLN